MSALIKTWDGEALGERHEEGCGPSEVWAERESLARKATGFWSGLNSARGLFEVVPTNIIGGLIELSMGPIQLASDSYGNSRIHLEGRRALEAG